MMYFGVTDQKEIETRTMGHVLPFYAVVEYIRDQYLGLFKPVLCGDLDPEKRFIVSLLEDNEGNDIEDKFYFFKLVACGQVEFDALLLKAMSAKSSQQRFDRELEQEQKEQKQAKEVQLDFVTQTKEFEKPKKRGGPRVGSGRKPSKRGKSVVMRVPEIFKDDVLKLIQKLTNELD